MSAQRINSNREPPRKTTPSNRPTMDPSGRFVVPSRKPEKPNFQNILERASENDFLMNTSNPTLSSTQPSATATREAVRAVASQQRDTHSQGKDDFKKKGKDSEDKRTDGPKDSVAPRAKEADQRVVARSSVSEHKGQGDKNQKGTKQESSSGQGQGKGGGAEFVSIDGKKLAGLAVEGVSQEGPESKFASLFSTMAKTKLELAASKEAQEKLSRSNFLPKAVLDQIVQYCRLVTKTNGDKEIEMQLHDKLFKGLKLRVAMVDQQVEATFTTESQELKNLFLSRKNDLKTLLSEKGIAVREITVIEYNR